MVLVLLLILALLLWTIQGELDAPKQQLPPTGSQCTNCQAQVDVEWMVCPHCQQRLRETCPACHKGKLVSHLFCTHCGEGKQEKAA